MPSNKTKTVKFKADDVNNLPNNKPAVYKITDRNGNNIYTGSAKRGRLEQRVREHLPGGPDAIRGGVKVQVVQKNSIKEAQKMESNIIDRSKPRFNKKGK